MLHAHLKDLDRIEEAFILSFSVGIASLVAFLLERIQHEVVGRISMAFNYLPPWMLIRL